MLPGGRSRAQSNNGLWMLESLSTGERLDRWAVVDGIGLDGFCAKFKMCKHRPYLTANRLIQRAQMFASVADGR